MGIAAGGWRGCVRIAVRCFAIGMARGLVTAGGALGASGVVRSLGMIEGVV